MRNNRILHTRQEARIYSANYRPSFNLWRFTKSILGVLISGSGGAAHAYTPGRKRGF